MKTSCGFLSLLLAGVGMLLTLPTVRGQASLAPDFAALSAQHERTLAALDAPIDQRYRASLTALLTRAQREHDPNMTAAIQQALARSLSQSSPLSPGPAAGAVSGIAGPARTPFVLPAPAASTPFAVATPTPPLLTPVGKWHWHSGPANTLTDKGAVVQGGNVVGQWRWTNKEKGELQIAWHGVRYRAPETFTLSPHGNHLNGSNPTDGTSFTEDRVEEGH